MNQQDDPRSSATDPLEKTPVSPVAPPSPPEAGARFSEHTAEPPASFASPLPGDPIDLAANSSAPWPPAPRLPEDLQIYWGWFHLLAFGLFAIFSFAMVQAGLLLYYVPLNSFKNQAEIERLVLSKPLLAVGTMVIWYGLLLLFLYVTVAVFHGVPFWRALGWRKIGWQATRWPQTPWVYLGSGCVLSLLVFAATAKMQPPENVPIEELFKYKNTAMMFMAMAVLVAPLVEETIFRGYLYPLFAKSFGVTASIAITGTLFGLMHGAQLGWTWELVTVLIVVGVVFTFVRARTGSVFASFLLHLGYNSLIAIFTVLGTEGFSKIPPTH